MYIKINKKLVLILIVVLTMSILNGCQKEPPNGFTQEFYNDIINTGQDIIKDAKNIKKEDVANSTIIHFDSYVEFSEKYLDNKNLTISETKAYKLLASIVLNINTDIKLFYNKNYSFPSDSTLDKISELNSLLETDIKIQN